MKWVKMVRVIGLLVVQVAGHQGCFFFGGAEQARERCPATEIGDGGDGGGERRLHCVRRSATLPAFLF